MFFSAKKRIIKPIGRLFRRRPWVILLVALVMFVSFTTAVVYEQYVINQDNLAKYLPPDTVFYFHANTLKSSFVNKSWVDFFSRHARFRKIWLDGWEEKYFSSWPRLNGSDHQEVAFALLPKTDSWQPVLLLFLKSDRGIEESIRKWRASGWHVARLDNVITVSQEPFYQWNTGEANLAKVLIRKKIPLANQFYVYLNKDNSDEWLPSLADNKFLLKFLSYWQKSESWAWYFFVRDNGLLITDNPSLLGGVNLKSKEQWIDNISGENVLLLKKVDLRSIWYLASENKDFLSGTSFDLLRIADKMRSRYGFDVLNSLILKQSAPANIYIGNFINYNSVLSQGKSEVSYIFEIPVSFNFSLPTWENFLKTAAGFSFPVEVEKVLPDGTKYRVKQARDLKKFNIKRESLAQGPVLNSVVMEGEEWNWHYVYNQGKLLVGNDKEMLISLLSGQIDKNTNTKDGSFCPIGEGSYIKYLPDFSKAAELGVDFILINQTNLGFLICAQ